MLFALEDYEGADMIPESIVHSLTLPDAGTELYEFVRERLVLFSEEQRKAVLHFLEYLEQCHAEDFTDICVGGCIRLLHTGRLKDGGIDLGIAPTS